MRARTLMVLVALALTSCVRFGPATDSSKPSVEQRDAVVIVGAFNFTESRVLAEAYRQILEDVGISAEVVDQVVSREIMEPALEQGEVDLVPEYVGTALTFLLASAGRPASERNMYRSLKDSFAERDITVLDRAPGQNRNEVVVRQDLARQHSLVDISDLTPIADELVFGGPPECPSRPLCLLGLQRSYRLKFESFLPLDSGGPLTVAALEGHEIDVALLFTTNPALNDPRFVVLRDDLGLQPPENVVPVVRSEVVSAYGEVFTDAIDAVSARLTDTSLRVLNHRAEQGTESIPVIVAEWLSDEGLI